MRIGQIDPFLSAAGGTYYLCVTGGGAPYSLVVTKNAAFSIEPNNSLTTPQDITGLTTVLGYVRQGEPGQPLGPGASASPAVDHVYQWDDGTQETALGSGQRRSAVAELF